MGNTVNFDNDFCDSLSSNLRLLVWLDVEITGYDYYICYKNGKVWGGMEADNRCRQRSHSDSRVVGSNLSQSVSKNHRKGHLYSGVAIRLGNIHVSWISERKSIIYIINQE